MEHPNLATVAFSYNPATLRRSTAPTLAADPSGESDEPVRFAKAPVETLSLVIQLGVGSSAAEDGWQLADNEGVMSQLAALEQLAYPALGDVMTNQELLSQGVIDAALLAAPSVNFMHGPRRALPVRIASLEVSEELFDDQLTPIRATVQVSMIVLADE